MSLDTPQMSPPAGRSAAAPDGDAAIRIGHAIRVLRNRAGLSQAEAGARLGTTGQGWSKYETGKSTSIFRPSVQRRLTDALAVPFEDLAQELARNPAEVTS